MHVQLNFEVGQNETIVQAILKKLGLPLTMQAPALPPFPVEQSQSAAEGLTNEEFDDFAKQVAAVAKTEPPKRRGRPPKGAASEPEVVEPTVDAAGISAAEAAEKVDAALATTSKSEVVPTFDDVRSVVQRGSEMPGVGIAGVRAVLTEFGVDKANKIPEAKWAEFIAAVEKKMEQ